MIQTISERAYGADIQCKRTENGADVQFHFRAIPEKTGLDRTYIHSFAVASAADSSLALNVDAELDKTSSTNFSVLSTISIPSGKYMLAGSAPMPPGADGKANSRQGVVFVSVDTH